MRVCAKCQRENQPHYRFCLGCGSELAPGEPASSPPWSPPRPTQPERCAYCEMKVPPSAARCPHCNAPL